MHAQPSPEATARSKALLAEGNRYLDQGNLVRAEQCYRQALALDGANPANLVNLGFVQIELGQLSVARDTLVQAIALDGANCDSQYLLGTVLESLGAVPEAAEHYRTALTLKPEFDVCCRDLVRVLFQLGRLDEAQTTLSQGLTLYPHLADLHFYQGHLGMAQGRTAQAAQDYQRAVELAPTEARLHSALGQAREKLNQLESAADSFTAAHTLEPDNPEHLKGLADIHQIQGRSASALALYQQGLARTPDHAGLLANMSLALCAMGQLDAARIACERAISVAPTMMAARNNLGITLTEMGELSGAVACLLQAIELHPEFAAAHCNLGAAYQKQGLLQQAIKSYRQALSLDENYLEAHSNLLFALSFSQEVPAAEFLAEAQAYGASATRLVSDVPRPTKALPLAPGRKLRVGLVSGDLHEHPVGYFLENVLRHLDQDRIELFAYAAQRRDDALTQRIRPVFHEWRTIAGLGDAQAAALIQSDGIDILMDLAGHTAHNRLALFAWRPAPLAVSWLGWFASTGLKEMDYFLADPVSVPASDEQHFSETIWYLPHTRFCFTSPKTKAEMEVSTLPALHAGHPTFGCFQQIGKVNDQVLAIWSRIAAALPLALFHIQNPSFNAEAGCEAFRKRLRAAGLPPERFRLCAASSREEYLKAYQTVDIALDTFPFNGATTTCEALWMGVPTVTLAGDRLVARQGASLMTAAGLADWVADSEEAYVTLAIQKASDLEALSKLRQCLRATVLTSPLFDAPLFANHLLQALEAMQATRLQPLVRV